MTDIEDNDIPTLLDVESTAEQRAPAPPSDAQAGTVPLTIITGFLGAGKSTLIKRILSERHGYRIAVIMNDFGDTADIEAKTINVSSADDPTALSEEVLELPNGCLCCSIKDTGVAAIEKLMRRKGAFDHILLETTGLADPGPIASLFWQNEEYATGLGSDIHLDGVVCVTDAVFGDQQMQEDHSEDGIGESLRQIACADVILINKVDLVSLEKLAILESNIKHINPTAIIHRTVRGEIKLKHILGIQAYAIRALEISTSRAPSREEGHDHSHEGDTCDHDHNPSSTHYEIRGITSLQVTCPTLTEAGLQALDEWIRDVLWEGRLPGEESSQRHLTVLRCKGMIPMQSGEIHLLQGVRSIYELAPLESGSEEFGVPQHGKVVFIGKGLDTDVRRSLEDTLAKHRI